MKVNYLTQLAAAMIVLLSTAAAQADDSTFAAPTATGGSAAAAVPAVATTPVAAPAPASYRSDGDTASYFDDSDPVRDFIVRAGGWATHPTGSPTKVGEYQGLGSSPFWNVDGIASDGDRTVDFSATQSDDVDYSGHMHYYGGPRLEADADWEQFPHELDAHEYNGWNYLGLNNTAGPGYIMGAGTKGSGAGNPQNPGSVVLYTNNNLSPGQDFAINVQEFKAKFQGHITDNLRWKVDVFGIDKEGFRQANVMQHCSAAAGNGSNLPTALPPGGLLLAPASGTYPANTAAHPVQSVPVADGNLTNQCHSVSQAQHIDWQTTECTPSLELRMGCDTTLEYSHLVRAFTANDQAVTYNYDTGSAGFSVNPTAVSALPFSTAATHGPKTVANQLAQQAAINNLTAGYAIVPDSETQIDRLKFATKVNSDTDAYVLGFHGYNEDQLRYTYRDFEGADLRVTNKSLDKLTVTGYAKYYREESTTPLNPLSPTPTPANDFYQEPGLGNGPQINRELHTFGINGRWCPFQDDCAIYASRLAFVGGYEYSSLLRENAGDTLASGASGQFIDAGAFTQPTSNKNTFTIGVEDRWTTSLNTYIRYKFIATDYPLYGITPDAGQLFAELNSALPTQENRVELGGTWTPNECLMVNATVYVENALNDGPYVSWNSNSVPFTISAWWAANSAWSFNMGAAELDNAIRQDVALSNLGSTPGVAIPVPWQYQGVADVLNCGFRYAATCKLAFTGMFEFVHGMNTSTAIVDPNRQVGTAWLPYGTPPYATYNIGQYSLVQMDSYRFELGADYIVAPRVTTYLRYNYYDYQDESGLTSGQVSMVLGGLSATF